MDDDNIDPDTQDFIPLSEPSDGSSADASWSGFGGNQRSHFRGRHRGGWRNRGPRRGGGRYCYRNYFQPTSSYQHHSQPHESAASASTPMDYVVMGDSQQKFGHGNHKQQFQSGYQYQTQHPYQQRPGLRQGPQSFQQSDNRNVDISRYRCNALENPWAGLEAKRFSTSVVEEPYSSIGSTSQNVEQQCVQESTLDHPESDDDS